MKIKKIKNEWIVLFHDEERGEYTQEFYATLEEAQNAQSSLAEEENYTDIEIYKIEGMVE